MSWPYKYCPDCGIKYDERYHHDCIESRYSGSKEPIEDTYDDFDAIGDIGQR